MEKEATSLSLREKLILHVCFERGFRMLTSFDEEGELVLPTSAQKLSKKMPIPLSYMEEWESFQKKGRVLFAKVDGMNVHFVILVRTKRTSWKEPCSLEEMVQHCSVFAENAPTINGTKLPVTVEVVELHRAGLDADYGKQIASYQRKGVMSPKIAVHVSAVDEKTGQVFANAHGVGSSRQKKMLTKVWKQDESLENIKKGMVESGFRAPHALLGTVLGFIFVVACFKLAFLFKVKNSILYGGIFLLGSLLGSWLSFAFQRFRRQTIAQSLVAGTAVLSLSTWFWWFSGGSVGGESLVQFALIWGSSLFFCYLFGASSETVDESVFAQLQAESSLPSSTL